MKSLVTTVSYALALLAGYGTTFAVMTGVIIKTLPNKKKVS